MTMNPKMNGQSFDARRTRLSPIIDPSPVARRISIRAVSYGFIKQGKETPVRSGAIAPVPHPGFSLQTVSTSKTGTVPFILTEVIRKETRSPMGKGWKSSMRSRRSVQTAARLPVQICNSRLAKAYALPPLLVPEKARGGSAASNRPVMRIPLSRPFSRSARFPPFAGAGVRVGDSGDSP